MAPDPYRGGGYRPLLIWRHSNAQAEKRGILHLCSRTNPAVHRHRFTDWFWNAVQRGGFLFICLHPGSFYHFAINIPANKIEEAKAWLASRVELIWIEPYKSDIADFVNWHAKSVYFYDPAGNIVELIARFDLDNKTGEPFSSSQFLSISEVGLVVKEDELDKTAENLIQQYGLSYFDKQPPLPQFKAIGDDEGLFIIVPDKRNWFPTSKSSGIFPMKTQFRVGKSQYVFRL